MEGVDWYLILNEEKIIWLFYFHLIKYLNLNLKEFWIQIKSNKLINIFKRYSISKKILLISLSLKYIYMIYMIFWMIDIWYQIQNKNNTKRRKRMWCGQRKKKKVFILFYFMIWFHPRLAEFSIHKARVVLCCFFYLHTGSWIPWRAHTPLPVPGDSEEDQVVQIRSRSY